MPQAGRRAGLALGCVLVLLLLYLVAVVSPVGQWADNKAFGYAQWTPSPLDSGLKLLGRRVLPALALMSAAVALLRATAQRRYLPALAAVVVAPVAVACSRALREVLWRPEYGYGYPYNTFPSTHVTLVAVLAVLVWLLERGRPAWLGRSLAAVVLVTMAGNVVGYDHRPSDVVGSLLVAGVVAGLARWAAQLRATASQTRA